MKPAFLQMNKLVKLGVLILITTYSTTLYSQRPHIKFEHISLEDGLSQSSVYGIAQDNKGFMWFATLDGLNKYDGYTIKVYRNKTGDSTSISDNVINCLYVDPPEFGGSLWIGTRGEGLDKFNQLNETFQSYSYNKNNSLAISNKNITAIIGSEKFLWIGTKNGLNRLNRKTKKYKHYYTKDGLAHNSVNHIFMDKTGSIWITTNAGLSKLDVETEKFETITFGNAPDLNNIRTGLYSIDGYMYLGTEKGLIKYNLQSKQFKVFKSFSEIKEPGSDAISSLVEGKDGIIWIGTDKGGLSSFDKKTEQFYTYSHDPSNLKSLKTNEILTLYQDKAGILWIGNSLGGINKWNRAAEDLSVFRHNPYNDQSLSSNQVRNIYEDNKGRIWIGTVQGGLNQFIVEQELFIHFKNKPNDPTSLPHNHVRTIIEDSKERFWVGTDGGGFCQFFPKTGRFKVYKNNPEDPTSISNNHVWRVIEDKKGQLWIATRGGGINIFNPENQEFTIYKHNKNDEKSLSNNEVTTIFEDHLGTIWVGTFGGGLNKWDEKTKTFKRYKYAKNDSSTIGNDRIYAIVEDSKGRLWIGTKGSLDLYDRKNDLFISYDEKDGFPNNVIMGILEDNEGNLWVSTNSGLSKFNPETKKLRNYNISDGLQSNEFLVGSFYKKRNGELIFGGIGGFNVFDPAKIKDNPNKPSVVITGFKVSNAEMKFDTAISEKKMIILDHTQKDISFDFVALDYIFPQKNQYKYRLIGFDKDWVDIKFQRYATYTNLPPGDYVFKVIGSNNDEVWNEEGAEISVIIEPAIWQRTWFKVTAIIILISTVLLLFYLRIRSIKKRNEHLEEQVKLRTAEVVKQRDQIQEQKKEIEDSIVYAKRIQTGTLPLDEYRREILPEHFVLFKPKDIVSGDFYWTGQKNGKSIAIAADCTGHGVPGAFMSMLGISFLNKIINEQGITRPDEILNKLRENVIKSLNQTTGDEIRDGMDIAVLSIDNENKKLQYAGANNPLYYTTDNQEIKVIKADKMPIALYELMDNFTLHEIDMEAGSSYYIFSDGYPDQFGGPKEKKFMYKRFRELLLKNTDKKMREQKEILDKTIQNWKGKIPQVDDIVVVGIRV